MTLNAEQKKQFEKLIQYREDIKKIVSDIDDIIKEDFPAEYAVAYQHWIPQILTALYNNTNWLPRGQYSMQDTINHINDMEFGSGVKKYIK
jgi:hypothetical protein